MSEKSNPILGIADWLAQESRLGDAKRVLDSVQRSKKSTKEDLTAANQLHESIKLKNREAVSKSVKKMIVMKKTSTLTPHPEIEKKIVIKSEDYKKIKEDIDHRGVQVPLVVDDKNRVICGVTRWKACKELEIDEVPCFEGSWDLFADMMDYAIKDNIMRRQLSSDERAALDAVIKREQDIAVIGRPPVEYQKKATKREKESIEKKANKILSKPTTTKVEPTKETLHKEYNWAIGHNSSIDAVFPSQTGESVKTQLELLKTHKNVKVSITYEVTKHVVS